MIGQKKKILIGISSNIFVRNFCQSAAFTALEQDYEVSYFFSPEADSPIDSVRCYRLQYDGVKQRSYIRARQNIISKKRYQNRSKSFGLVHEALLYPQWSPWTRLRFSLASLPGIAEAFIQSQELLLGTVRAVDELIDQIKPDLMIVPSGLDATASVDFLQSARKKKVKNLLLMGNWDNLCSKGVLPFIPDHIAVWGEQTREHAQDIQGIPASQIHILGAPQFEVYFYPPKESREDVLARNGIPLGKRVLLFVGASRCFDELDYLGLLDKAIEAGKLANAHILYRPHPWKGLLHERKSFFDYNFKHITMDIQLRDHYKNLFVAAAPNKRLLINSFIPDYSYYPSLFNAVDGVICPVTTMGIEAMLAAKPVLMMVFSQETFKDKKGKVYKLTAGEFEHLQCWNKMPSVQVSYHENEFVDDCGKFLQLIEGPAIKEKVREEVKYVVYHDNRRYPQRLKECVDQIININSPILK